MATRRKNNYKVMACFDTETNNDQSSKSASAVCYQLSVLHSHIVDCREIFNENVNRLLTVTIDRHFTGVCARFDELIRYGKAEGIVPVVMVHNLAFEMWILSSYLNAHETTVCAKSTVKPLTISIMENDNAVLVFWDTLSFWGKPLSVLGDECCYPKLVGCWDYQKHRTPDTPLSDMELAYAREDVIVPWAYLGYFLRLNTDIDEHDLACSILTKTSTVRYKSKKRCAGIHVGNKTTGYMWYRQNIAEKPKTDDELELIHAATRGGFTYCAANHAGKAFHSENGMHILKYDANSMHICHALAHRVPVKYRWKEKRLIAMAFRDVENASIEYMLKHYDNPFPCSKFYAKFRFTNVRLKAGSIYERDGISTLASTRFSDKMRDDTGIVDNEGGIAFDNHLSRKGVHDWASEDAVFAFGKFLGASECELILNELSAWEFTRQFDYDSWEVVGNGGLLTGKSELATDKSVLSFNEFYKRKSIFKKLKNAYERHEPYQEFSDFVPEYLAQRMKEYDPSVRYDVEVFYLSVKSELNALYGIEATNEAKNDILMGINGLIVGEYKGVAGLPRAPKAWYQYGSHIVGWSRVHQLLFMELLKDKVSAFVCGDTDSHKLYTKCSTQEIEQALKPLHDACDRSIEICTKRARAIKEWYPMPELGWYECEGECDALCAAWNKSYITQEDGLIDITMAGVPCNNKFVLADGKIVDHSYNKLANMLFKQGRSFDYISSILLGYNVSITHDITGLNARKLPGWSIFDDATGEPSAIFIEPMTKTIGSTRVIENSRNAEYAKRNNPNVNTNTVIIDWPLTQDKPSILDIDSLADNVLA